MKIKQVKLLSLIDRFCYWINEREAIRLKRVAEEPAPWTGDKILEWYRFCNTAPWTDDKILEWYRFCNPAPWTDDKILERYRFCNVVRMDDKVSQWLLNNWYKPYFDHPNMLIACAIARFFNLPASLELITKYVFGKRWGAGPAKRIKEILRKRKAAGETVFNGAYMVRGMEAEDKIGSVLDAFIPSIAKIKTNGESMEALWSQLMDCYGWGSFMAGQVVADMRWATSGKWLDRNSWASAGPGSMRGLNRIHGRPIKTPMKQEAFLTELLELRDNCCSKVSPINLRMEMHDWQNCLCEFDKYERVLQGEGRPKSLYRSVT